jgi:hypothetical protein
MFISDLRIGDQVESFYILQNATAKTTMSGKPFLSMVLGDASGSIDAQIWDYPGPVTPKDTGSVIKVRGVVSDYKGAQQITVDRLRLASADDQYSRMDCHTSHEPPGHDYWICARRAGLRYEYIPSLLPRSRDTVQCVCSNSHRVHSVKPCVAAFQKLWSRYRTQCGGSDQAHHQVRSIYFPRIFLRSNRSSRP